jgi:hypothetical protein
VAKVLLLKVVSGLKSPTRTEALETEGQVRLGPEHQAFLLKPWLHVERNINPVWSLASPLLTAWRQAPRLGTRGGHWGQCQTHSSCAHHTALGTVAILTIHRQTGRGEKVKRGGQPICGAEHQTDGILMKILGPFNAQVI